MGRERRIDSTRNRIFLKKTSRCDTNTRFNWTMRCLRKIIVTRLCYCYRQESIDRNCCCIFVWVCSARCGTPHDIILSISIVMSGCRCLQRRPHDHQRHQKTTKDHTFIHTTLSSDSYSGDDLVDLVSLLVLLAWNHSSKNGSPTITPPQWSLMIENSAYYKAHIHSRQMMFLPTLRMFPFPILS